MSKEVFFKSQIENDGNLDFNLEQRKKAVHFNKLWNNEYVIQQNIGVMRDIKRNLTEIICGIGDTSTHVESIINALSENYDKETIDQGVKNEIVVAILTIAQKVGVSGDVLSGLSAAFKIGTEDTTFSD